MWRNDDASWSNEATLGAWNTEEESTRVFDDLAEKSGYFKKIYAEVGGQYLQPRLHTKERACRIDRILFPSEKLEAAGWPHGPIGVELEASRRKIAGPIEQAMDYSRAVWTIKDGYHIVLEWFFIWPWAALGGNVGSLAVQNRIGGVFVSRANLTFVLCSQNAISTDKDGTIRAKRISAGNKTGHRART